MGGLRAGSTGRSWLYHLDFSAGFATVRLVMDWRALDGRQETTWHHGWFETDQGRWELERFTGGLGVVRSPKNEVGTFVWDGPKKPAEPGG